MAYPATFRLWQDHESEQIKKPFLVFGPDLPQKIATLVENKQHGAILHKHDDVPTFEEKFSSEDFTKTYGNVRFSSVHTGKMNRNTPKSGITSMKSIFNYIISSNKDHDIDDDQVDRDLVTIVCDKDQLVPIAGQFGRAFPMFCMKSSTPTKSRNLKLNFVSVDDGNKCDKACLIQLIDNVRNAARIGDTPCNFMHTNQFIVEAEQVKASLNNDKVTMKVIKGTDLRDQGFGGLWGVGQAAVNLPALCILSYTYSPEAKNICLVGKGIVYDTGGLSIKTKTGMPGMKHDCGGAAGLLFGWKNIVQQEPKENFHVLLCLAENSVSKEATRPDDIITLYSGKTVEVNNTDAEGRLVLGDGVAYACKDLNADIVLDMCTLTGAQGITTGHLHAALLTNRHEWERKVVDAGMSSGDLAFPILYAPELLMHEFKSVCADLKNSVQGRANAQCSCAGHFIEYHLKDGHNWDGDWLHVDMAYPSMENKIIGGDRATGFGVALISKLFNYTFQENEGIFQ